MKLIVYRTASGREPFAKWYAKLEDHASARVTTALARVEAGNLASAKSVGGGVQELRIDLAQATASTKRQQADIEQARASGPSTSVDGRMSYRDRIT